MSQKAAVDGQLGTYGIRLSLINVMDQTVAGTSRDRLGFKKMPIFTLSSIPIQAGVRYKRHLEMFAQYWVEVDAEGLLGTVNMIGICHTATSSPEI